MKLFCSVAALSVPPMPPEAVLDELLSLSDRIAVFARGKIEQVDTPRALYQKPATSFVADFVGGANVLRGDLARACGTALPCVAIRPEQIRVRAGAVESITSAQVSLPGTLVDIQFHGASSHYEVDVQGQLLTAVVANNDDADHAIAQIGNAVALSWPRHLMVELEQ